MYKPKQTHYVSGRISEDTVKSMVFHLHDVVRCSAIDTDLDYATKGDIVFLFYCLKAYCISTFLDVFNEIEMGTQISCQKRLTLVDALQVVITVFSYLQMGSRQMHRSLESKVMAKSS